MTFLCDILPEIRRIVADPHYGGDVPERNDTRPRPSLRKAILEASRSGGLIVEYKRFSPGQAEPHLPERSVRALVEATRSSTTAYSCLATPPRFHGSPRDVAELVEVADRPVLFKDIVVDPRQLEVAARTGASAVLLIARLTELGLSPGELAALAGTAHRLGLEVVLEFHHGTELSRTTGVPADVFGVNARDLESLAIDRATAEATIVRAAAEGRRPLLGLSGVESADDARRFWSHGVDGILVGTAVARSRDPAALLATLVRPTPGESR